MRLLLVLLLLLLPYQAAAHPHVFIDYRVTVVGDTQGVRALHVTFGYDVAYSSLILSDLGLGGKTIFDAVVAEKIRHMNDDELSKHRFYIEGMANDQPLMVNTSNLRAHTEKAHLVLEFDVLLPKPARKITFSVFDPTFYTAFTQVKEKPLIVDIDGLSCLIKTKGYATPFGIMITHPVECSFNR